MKLACACAFVLGCTTGYEIDVTVDLLPTCTCSAAQISLGTGGTLGWTVQEGAMVLDQACLTIEPGASNVRDVVPGLLASPTAMLGPLDGGTVTFMLNVARPASSIACDPEAAFAAPLILQGRTDPIALDGDATIGLLLDCLDACP